MKRSYFLFSLLLLLQKKAKIKKETSLSKIKDNIHLDKNPNKSN